MPARSLPACRSRAWQGPAGPHSRGRRPQGAVNESIEGGIGSGTSQPRPRLSRRCAGPARTGVSCRQGPHHVAYTSIRTAWLREAAMTAWNACSLSISTTGGRGGVCGGGGPPAPPGGGGGVAGRAAEGGSAADADSWRRQPRGCRVADAMSKVLAAARAQRDRVGPGTIAAASGARAGPGDPSWERARKDMARALLNARAIAIFEGTLTAAAAAAADTDSQPRNKWCTCAAGRTAIKRQSFRIRLTLMITSLIEYIKYDWSRSCSCSTRRCMQ